MSRAPVPPISKRVQQYISNNYGLRTFVTGDLNDKHFMCVFLADFKNLTQVHHSVPYFTFRSEAGKTRVLISPDRDERLDTTQLTIIIKFGLQALGAIK